MNKSLSMAVPKGRLLGNIMKYLNNCGLSFDNDDRKLFTRDNLGFLELYKVKNHDLPIYLQHGIMGLGIMGDDRIIESRLSFTHIFTLPFGTTRLCLAAPVGTPRPEENGGTVTVATSYVRKTREWFNQQGLPVKIIKLNGSVELAPALGLSTYIVDLVETGTTLLDNNLEIQKELALINVRLVANQAYYKLHYQRIRDLTDIMDKGK